MRISKSPGAGLAAAAALLMLITGCGSGDNTSTAAQPEPAASSPATSTTPPGTPSEAGTGTPSVPATPTPTVPEILKFSANTTDGAAYDPATLAGKNVVLWFWAPWCPTCARASESVISYAKSAGDDIVVVGVAGLSQDQGAMQDFVARNDISGISNLADSDGEIYARFGVTQQHSFAFVDGETGEFTQVNAYAGADDLGELANEAFAN